MQLDLSGKPAVVQPPVWAFADEAKPANGCPWFYIGVLLLRQPDVIPIVDDLVALRGAYGGEVHFRETTHSTKRDVALRWLDFAIADTRLKFSAVGIRQNVLRAAAFGAGGSEFRRRVHGRFLHPVIASAAKRGYGRDVCLGGIVHDHSDELAADSRFATAAVRQLEKRHSVRVDKDRVIFIDSDHREAGDRWRSAILLQFVDLLLGATRQCMENTSRKQHVRQVAQAWLPVVERLTDPGQRWNRNSQYRHADRFDISFFPRRSLTESELENPLIRAAGGLYRNRTPAMSHSTQEQFAFGDECS